MVCKLKNSTGRCLKNVGKQCEFIGCEGECKKFSPVTNYDKILYMGVEELAEFIVFTFSQDDYKDYWLNWLREPWEG